MIVYYLAAAIWKFSCPQKSLVVVLLWEMQLAFFSARSTRLWKNSTFKSKNIRTVGLATLLAWLIRTKFAYTDYFWKFVPACLNCIWFYTCIIRYIWGHSFSISTCLSRSNERFWLFICIHSTCLNIQTIFFKKISEYSNFVGRLLHLSRNPGAQTALQPIPETMQTITQKP